jgi:hypothetical protein
VIPDSKEKGVDPQDFEGRLRAAEVEIPQATIHTAMFMQTLAAR